MNDPNETIKQFEILHEILLSEDSTLKYDFVISLQKMAMIKIITSIWIYQTAQKRINDQSFGLFGEMEENVRTTLSELCLPSTIIRNLSKRVDSISESLFRWFQYHNKFIFDGGAMFKDRDFLLKNVNNIKWNCKGKIDYFQTAKNILANKDYSFSDICKYRFACNYCLEDEIAIIAPEILDRYDLYTRCNRFYDRYNLHYVNIERYPMVYFWTAQITGDSRFSCPHNNMSLYEYVFRSLFNSGRDCTHNDVPIRYIWYRLSEEEKSRNIAPLIKELGSQDFRYSLLSTLNYEQQQELFKEYSGVILRDMLYDWLWEEYFLPTALHVLDIMEPDSYMLVLMTIISKLSISKNGEKYICDQYRSMFTLLWQEGSQQLKDHFFDRVVVICNGNDPFSLGLSPSWRRGMRITEMIFKDLNAEQKKKLIYSPSGIIYCTYLIQNDQLELLAKYIHSFSAEEINRLKQKLMTDKGRDIAEYFLKKQAFDKAEHFLKWAFKSTEEAIQFKERFIEIMYDTIIYESIDSGEIDFVRLENYFNWCADGDLVVACQFKTDLIAYGGELLIKKLIRLDNYNLLDEILSWCFSDNKLQIAQYKSNMYKNYIYSHILVSLASGLLLKDNSVRLLDKFINWCFTDGQEKQSFKQWLLYSQNNDYCICITILVEKEFELADEFIKWCGVNSPEDIREFKNELMFSRHRFRIISTIMKNVYPLLIKWLNPSKEAFSKFKKLVPKRSCPPGFYRHLKEFIANRDSFY